MRTSRKQQKPTTAIGYIRVSTDEQAESPATEAYLQAYAKLEANDPGASQAFAAVVGQYGEDPLATFHLKRLLAGEKGDVTTFEKK